MAHSQIIKIFNLFKLQPIIKLIILLLVAIALSATAIWLSDHHYTVGSFLLFVAEHIVPDLAAAMIVYLLLKEGIDFLTGMAKVLEKPIDRIISSIGSAKETKNQVRILDTQITDLLDYKLDNDETFLHSIKSALEKNKVSIVQILILHPSSNAAKQRQLDLIDNEDRQNLLWVMREDISNLYKFKYECLEERYRHRLEILLYDSTPPFSFIAWDSNAFISFFRNKSISTFETNLKIIIESKLGHVVDDVYKNISTSTDRITSVEDYMTIELWDEYRRSKFKTRFYFCGDNNRHDYPAFITATANANYNERFLDTKCNKQDDYIFVQLSKKLETFVVKQKYHGGSEKYNFILDRFINRYNWDTTNDICASCPPIYKVQSLKEFRQEQLMTVPHNFVATAISRKKYISVPGPDIIDYMSRRNRSIQNGLEQIKNYYSFPNNLKQDENVECRFRCYREFDYSFLTDKLEPNMNDLFPQSRDYLSPQSIKERRFKLIPDEIAKGDFIQSLIRFDLLNIYKNSELCLGEWKIKLHFIRIVCSNKMAGTPSPEMIHTDNHDFIAVHFLGRQHIKGGHNQIYTNKPEQAKKILNKDEKELYLKENSKYLIEQISLNNLMDTLYVNDRRVKHYVTDIECIDIKEGYRDIMIVDFDK